MAKIMLFIDGTWLYRNTSRLEQSYGEAIHIDYGKLPRVLAQEVSQKLGTDQVDLVRTYLFGSYASNCHTIDEESATRRSEFFDMLKEEYHYEVETFPIDFAGRRLRRQDRDPLDAFEPEEKCVDVALATNMLYLAAIPYAYDIAIAVIGDRDFMPMLQSVRRLGKRVAIASIKNSCASEFADPLNKERVKDFDIIWIDDLLDMIQVKYERHKLACASPLHKGNPLVWTTFHPRKGKKFYCDQCQQEFQKTKQEAERKYVNTQQEAVTKSAALGECAPELHLTGKVRKIMEEKGYGFITAKDGGDYIFYHNTDLLPGLEFKDMTKDMEVDFKVKQQPNTDKEGKKRAGRAVSISVHNAA